MTRYSATALVLLAIGTASAAEKTLDKTFTVSPGGSLMVDADSASVRVSAGDTDKVTVRMSAHGSDEDLAKMKFEAVQQADGVTVTMRRQETTRWFHWGSWNGESRIEITVPKQFQTSVRTGGGEVTLAGTTGSARLQTSGGDITAKNVTGNVEARTSGGGIVVDTIRGDVNADTSGGDVRLLKIDGKIRGNTSGGSVRVSLVGANRGISATTSGGDIELILPRATAGNVNATTSGGGITLDIPVTTTDMKDSRVRGTINGGGQPIDAHTSGGSISLRASD